jgi:DNA-binding response OmpR family regulator
MRSALVVNDNQDLAQAIAAGLQSEGFQVRTANNGLHGCAYYFREPTDLVVTDIQISELDGVETMRRIRGGESESTRRLFECCAHSGCAGSRTKRICRHSYRETIFNR